MRRRGVLGRWEEEGRENGRRGREEYRRGEKKRRIELGWEGEEERNEQKNINKYM